MIISYKGLQLVRRGYRGLQGVTGVYKGLKKTCFLRRTPPNLCVLCIKRNVNEVSDFWRKPYTNPFGKMQILWFFKPMFS